MRRAQGQRPREDLGKEGAGATASAAGADEGSDAVAREEAVVLLSKAARAPSAMARVLAEGHFGVARPGKGMGRRPIATRPPNLGSETAFPQLGGRKTGFVSQNLDVQRAEKLSYVPVPNEKLSYVPVPNDRLVFIDEDVAEAKKE